MNLKEKQLQIGKIKKAILRLKNSPFYKERIKNNYIPVVGEGSLNAKIIFIGEAPGKNEAMSGKPFCGMSGKVLDRLLDSINLDREDIYITNIVNDRRPKNRDPKPKEIEMYSKFLDRQIGIIQPKIIATLGRFSAEYIMNRFNIGDKFEEISKLHGKSFKINLNKDKKRGKKIIIIPLFHPAVAIYNRKRLPELKKDFKKMGNILSKI